MTAVSGTGQLGKAHSEDVAVPVARVIASTTYGQVARDDVEAAKKLILDVLGAAVAGRFEPGCVELLGLMTEFGGSGQACVIGGGRLPVPAAVAVNATMCRALELDDVSEQALIHTAASVVPAALAAADHSAEPVSGERLIAAVAVGVDVANRLSLAPGRVMDGPQYRPRGMSYSFQIGTFAAAAAAASIWGFDAETVLNALGLAYSQAAGNQQGVIDGVLAVRVQQGLSASAGVLAAMMAGRGISGALSPLEGKFGYYPVYCGGQWDRSVILDGLGERFTVGDVSIKPYPCCKYSHTAIAAAMLARQDPRFDPAKVERVLVHVDNREYFNVVCDPIEKKRRPQGTVEAQFSLPYTVGTALLHGSLALPDFENYAWTAPDRLLMAAKVEPLLGEPRFLTNLLPTPSRVEVILTDGTVITKEAEVAPGHPRNPFSWDDLESKVWQMATHPRRPLPTAQIVALVEACRNLEQRSDVRDLVAENLAW